MQYPSAGSDTVYVVRRLTSITAHLSYQTVITLSMPSLALCHHPEVLQKAHEQLDEVLGLDRLPTLDDRPRLPYIDCILKEVLR